MKKIAFVSTNKSSWGGSEYLWYLAALKLKDDGKSVIVSIPRWKEIPAAVSTIISGNIKVLYNTDRTQYKRIVNRFLPGNIFENLEEEGYLFLLDFKPDIVVVNQGGNTGGIDLMEFCIKYSLPFVTISNAANEAKWPSDELNKRLSFALPKALKNYFVSRANLNLTELQIGQKIINSKIIFNPFNVDYDFDFPYPEVTDNYILANVARHEFYAKGQDILFQVLNESKWRERNIKVNLYGNGEHSGSLKKLKDHFKLTNVSIEGYADPNEIWKKCHALILTSRYEGLPLALVEAMLCGRTGLVTKVSGIPEIVIDNENGFIAGAATPEFVDEAMERAWSKKNEWKEMGIKAKEYVRSLIPQDPVGYFCNELKSLKI